MKAWCNLITFRKFTTGSKSSCVDENKSQMQPEASANDLFLEDEKEDPDDLLEVETYGEAISTELGMSNNEVDVAKSNDYYRLYDIKYQV